MKIGNAFFAGVVGGVAASVIMGIARVAGAGADLMLMLGTLSGNEPSGSTWLLGCLLAIIGSGLTGILYAAAFEHITRSAGVRAGLLVSLVHLALGGLAVGLLGVMHPLVPHAMPAPGLFMAAYGPLGVLAFIASHLAFGAIVGAIYKKAMIERVLIID